jgi:hypothetical protein
MLGIVGVLSGFVIAFLGLNSGRPSGAISLWDNSYAGIYFLITLIVSVPLGLLAWPYLNDWLLDAGHGRSRLVAWLGLLIAAAAAAFDVLNWWPRSVGVGILMGVAGFLCVMALGVAVRTAVRVSRRWR